MLDAIAILSCTKRLEDLGRPVSPLVPRRPERGVEPAVKDLVQRWWHDLGEDVNATIASHTLTQLSDELRALQPKEGEGA